MCFLSKIMFYGHFLKESRERYWVFSIGVLKYRKPKPPQPFCNPSSTPLQPPRQPSPPIKDVKVARQQSERWHEVLFELRIFLQRLFWNVSKLVKPSCCGIRKSPAEFPPNFQQNMPVTNQKFTDEPLQERRERKMLRVDEGESLGNPLVYFRSLLLLLFLPLQFHECSQVAASSAGRLSAFLRTPLLLLCWLLDN